MTSFEALWRAYMRYQRGKRRRPPVAAFDLVADSELLALHRNLRSGTYRPGRYHLKIIHDPKTRLIAAPSLLDRVLHQALVDEIGPTYERSFLADAYACGKGRGPQRAVLRYLQFSRRHRLRLALDIRRYFLSIHSPTLCHLIGRRLRDAGTRRLVERLVEAGRAVYRHPLAVLALGLDGDPVPPEAGLPIGSYLSQWSGSLYLDGLDHFVKRRLKIAGYLRFMDDFTLFDDDAQKLAEARLAITDWLWRERRLQLNPKRRTIVPAAQPSVYLGYRVSRSGILPSRKMKRRMKKRLRALRQQGVEQVGRSLCSYRGLMLFG